jgi:hypothetical protein
MNAVFADTSYYVALFHENDVRHGAAVRFSQEDVRPVLVTDFVLLELANTFCRGHARKVFVDLVRHLRADPLCRIVPVSKALFEAGLRLFAHRADKDWSLTDCISFVVMRQHGLSEALTTDHHFEQAGFKALLK